MKVAKNHTHQRFFFGGGELTGHFGSFGGHSPKHPLDAPVDDINFILGLDDDKLQ